MERYTFKIQTNPHPKNHNGKTYVFFSGISMIDQEQGKRKDTVKVARNCYCEGSVWNIFLSKKRKQELLTLGWQEYMNRQLHFLGLARTVIVEGITDEKQFGKKGMLVSKAEVVVQPKIEKSLFNNLTGFEEPSDKEF